MKVIITGGAGFIGCNAASRFLRRGDHVIVIDNLSRPGGDRNLAWLQGQGTLTALPIDVRESGAVDAAFREHRDAGLVLHCSGQVAVTTSVADPRTDFDTNALGAFNLLEAARHAKVAAPLIYCSTNKVYGHMEEVGIVERDGRYAYGDRPLGVSESQGLDFHSPYGCSKGAADQYFRDYHRIYGLKTVVFRQSCIYGYRQFGLEDQGWVAWFTIATQLGRPITVYGDGKQVRDVLFIDDLVDAFELAARHIDRTAGRVYNIGGGPENTISLLDLLEYLGQRAGREISWRRGDWRPGDQKVFVSDIRRAAADLGWSPKVGWRRGLGLLYDWVASNAALFQ